MDLESQVERRGATIRRRRAPGAPARVHLPFDAPVTVRDDSPIGPMELDIEATGPDGTFAAWLDDEWWAEAITHWAEDDVTVRIAPTPDALTHPILRHQLEMLRRVVPSWKLVAYSYRDDVDPESDIAEVATAPFHEIRFLDALRPDRPAGDRPAKVKPLPVLFSRIRSVQMERRVVTPILVRMPAATSFGSVAQTKKPFDTCASTDPCLPVSTDAAASGHPS